MARSKKEVKVKYNILDALDRVDMEMEATGDYLPLLGNSALTIPSNTSSQRTQMFNKHVGQSLTLVKSDFPRVYTGAENVYGKYSAYHKQYDHNIKVERIVRKYKHIKKNKYAAAYFIKHLDTGIHDVIFRKEVEDLDTNHGFTYVNKTIDQLEEGEVVGQGTELYASTAYDEHGNHGYGVNAVTMFSFHPGTTEDAAIISESLSKRLTTDYVYTVNVQLNKDDVLLNLYGDENNYKCLPDVGETVKHGVLCAVRKVKMNQAFVDMRESELRRTDVLGDRKFYCEGEVVGINIFVSSDDVESNAMTKQWYDYYLDQLNYYRDIYDFCKSTSVSGEPMSATMKQLLSDSSKYINDQCKWVLPTSKNILNGVYMKITIRQRLPAWIGQKITGRYGNKNVVSKIVADDKMPKLDDGRRVDFITNGLSVFNRNIPFVLDESFITRATRIVVEKYIKPAESREEKMAIFMDTITTFCPTEAASYRNLYDSFTDGEKRRFIEAIEKDGIYIKLVPFRDTSNMLDTLVKLAERYPLIMKEDKVLVWYPPRNEFRPALNGAYVGEQYILVLKQNGKTGFSCRSSGTVSEEGLPIKSNDQKNYTARFSNTPIRMGEYETPIACLGIQYRNYGMHNLLTRSSPEGRAWIVEHMLNDNIKIPKKLSSRPAEINNLCYFKMLGFRVDIFDNRTEYCDADNETLIGFQLGHTTLLCTEADMFWMKKIAKRYSMELRKHPKLSQEDLWKKTLDKIWTWDKLPDELICMAKANIEDLMAVMDR